MKKIAGWTLRCTEFLQCTAAESVHRHMSGCSFALWVRMATHHLETRPPEVPIVWIWGADYVQQNPCNSGWMPYTFTAMWNKHTQKSWVPLTRGSETEDRFAFIYFRLPSPSDPSVTALWFHTFPAASEGSRTVMSMHFQPARFVITAPLCTTTGCVYLR